MKRKDGYRGAAKAAGLPEYFTGKPCKRGHVCARWTVSGHCKQCSLENLQTAQWRAYRRKHFERNRELVLEQSREYYAAHKQAVTARISAWRDKNSEKLKVYQRNWHVRHPVSVRVKVVRYRARKLRAMPSWVSTKDIEHVYRECRRRTQETGVIYHVDHIVPLKGKTVCGLHVAWNLQIITAHENQTKRNKFAA